MSLLLFSTLGSKAYFEKDLYGRSCTKRLLSFLSPNFSTSTSSQPLLIKLLSIVYQVLSIEVNPTGVKLFRAKRETSSLITPVGCFVATPGGLWLLIRNMSIFLIFAR